MTVSLAGQVALVTGASGGIGGGIAIALARQGLSLALVGRKTEILEAQVAKTGLEEARVRPYPIDLEDDEAIRDLTDKVLREFGRVDILIHCAGIFRSGTLEKTSVEDLDRQFRVNLRAPYLLTQCLLPALRKQKGQIVFINSTTGLSSRGTVGQYAASKHGLKAIADSLRDEVNPYGIRVLSLFVGRTATSLQKRIHEEEGKEYRADQLIQTEDVAALVVFVLALPRSVEVTDVRLRPMAKPC